MRELFVSNVPYSFSSLDLHELFAQVSEPLSARIIEDRETGASRGFGFVNYEHENDARKALVELNGFVVEGRALRIRESIPREQRAAAHVAHG